jgi:electron-transferring-flavoprotein dehydrogenase
LGAEPHQAPLDPAPRHARLHAQQGHLYGQPRNLCRWLAGQAEALGVEIFPGFSASEVLYNEDGSVKGVATGDMGVARDGTHRADYQPGMELHGRYTFFAEGARGHLTKQVKRVFDLEAGRQPQVYGLGVKELWDIDPDKHQPGRVIHTQGWPLDDDNWGGGFLITRPTTRSRLWASSVALNYRTPISRRSRSSSAGSSTRRSADSSRAASASATARERSTRAATSHTEARLSPGGAADRLLGRLRQRAAHQGQPHGDQVGNARREAAFACDRRDRSNEELPAYEESLHSKLGSRTN